MSRPRLVDRLIQADPGTFACWLLLLVTIVMLGGGIILDAITEQYSIPDTVPNTSLLLVGAYIVGAISYGWGRASGRRDERKRTGSPL